MRALRMALVMSCGLALLSGCAGVAGHWNMSKATPQFAADRFQYESMCLNPNGQFHARCDNNGQVRIVHGTYKYNAVAKELTLTRDNGTRTVVYAEPLPNGNGLKLWNNSRDQNWTVVMNTENCGCRGNGYCCKPRMQVTRAKKYAAAADVEPTQDRTTKTPGSNTGPASHATQTNTNRMRNTNPANNTSPNHTRYQVQQNTTNTTPNTKPPAGNAQTPRNSRPGTLNTPAHPTPPAKPVGTPMRVRPGQPTNPQPTPMQN